MFVLDTNVVSELRRPERSNPNVQSWIADQAPSELYLSAVTILELEIGARRMERKDGRQGSILLSWIERQVLPLFADRILPIDLAVARRCALLHVPDRRNDRDAYIAATARVHGMTVVTRNISDFEGTGVPLINPWQERPV
ncbi:type II toxin-antitoxin system VapC family toxin [Kaistia nematophila]|uniref:Ribonuclease VapC n=1 Tax=Kaistia nematophila TaxID=2994654 RepID=A0A9X3E0G2_9HYPH|nr:type II toxin-antitoxin system VapC family toxin [Kaistia nematophila]MCX5568846.1 type II toxin-antitoxin system VapC family toxin [Kaistia nematophila]